MGHLLCQSGAMPILWACRWNIYYVAYSLRFPLLYLYSKRRYAYRLVAHIKPSSTHTLLKYSNNQIAPGYPLLGAVAYKAIAVLLYCPCMSLSQGLRVAYSRYAH